MSKADKLLARMAANPRDDWTIENLKTVARAKGVEWRQVGTSHVVFTWPSGRAFPVPAHRPVKPVYVRKFVTMIQEG